MLVFGFDDRFTMALSTQHGPTTHFHALGTLYCYLRCVPLALLFTNATGESGDRRITQATVRHGPHPSPRTSPHPKSSPFATVLAASFVRALRTLARCTLKGLPPLALTPSVSLIHTE
jgi:hypothetical protein